VPVTLPLGVGLILILEALLFADVAWSRRGAVRTQAAVAAVRSVVPGSVAAVARFVAVNFTPLIWPAYLVLLDGLLVMQTGASPIRERPHHFATLCLASIFIWCVFDWVNFYYIHAWTYIGMPGEGFWGWLDRFWGYALAFGSVVPGMLLTSKLILNTGAFDWARSRAWRMPRFAKWVALWSGVAMFVYPLVVRDPKANLTLWTSLVFFLDPINLKLGRPSMFRDWQNGWYGRTLAGFAGGLVCGLLWEFWNYWALAKWTYTLPFLGRAEAYRYFEMPLPGLLGFLPFAIECWVMWQSLRVPLDGMVEPLPDERSFV